MLPRTPSLIVAGGLLLASALPLGGCAVFGLASVMGQSFEYQKRIEVPPQYAGLEHQNVAVVADADLSILYEHPGLISMVISSVSQRIAQNVPGVRVLSPQAVLAWQYRTPQWSAMPYGHMAESLGVDRIVYLDIYEYRLNPPGNRYLWEGVCAADVGIIERDGIDPDMFVDSFHVQVRFPEMEGVGRESAGEAQIAQGVLTRFVQQAAWLFYLHEEPKYPDKYRPELETG